MLPSPSQIKLCVIFSSYLHTLLNVCLRLCVCVRACVRACVCVCVCVCYAQSTRSMMRLKANPGFIVRLNFATRCEYSRSGHPCPSLCAAICHSAAVLSAGTRCANSRNAVSKCLTPLQLSRIYTKPKQRPCGAHSNLPTSHNTWFPVCKRRFH